MSEQKVRSMISRWAVEIEGHHFTIDRLRKYLSETLNSPNDTFISVMRNVPVIRCKLWDSINDAAIVAQLAETEVALLQGLTKLAGGASSLRIGTIFELNSEDGILRQSRGTLNDVQYMKKSCEEPDFFLHRMNVARQNDAIAGAIIEISGKPDWIKIYKAIEYLEEHFGGEKQMAAALPNEKAALKRIKRTAQSVRHRARAFSTIKRPYDLKDAEKFVRALLNEIVSSIPVRGKEVAPFCYVIREREYSPDEQIGINARILVNGEESEIAFDGDTLSIVHLEKP